MSMEISNEQLYKINNLICEFSDIVKEFKKNDDHSEYFKLNSILNIDNLLINNNKNIGLNLSQHDNSIKNNNGDFYMKNVRHRADGRWEYRKMIKGKSFNIISRNKEDLIKKIKTYKKQKTNEPIIKTKLIDIIWDWYNLYKKDKIASYKTYEYTINKHFSKNLFNQHINNIQLFDLQNFLNSIKEHRIAKYCYYIIKGAYFYALQNNIVKKDISMFLVTQKNKTNKGTNFTFKEQQLIIQNLDKTDIKHEVLFYLLTGCRRTEGINVKSSDINFEKKFIFINGTKTKSAKRYIPISKNFADILSKNFNNMFKKSKEYYTKEFQRYLKMLNIKNKKLHDLRHTFSTNLYYLGVPDKERQYYMGHSSIVITNDIYTTLDPSINKNDILKLYNNLYPSFDPKFDPKN